MTVLSPKNWELGSFRGIDINHREFLNKGTCVDINECENGTHNCGSKQCFNVEGTFRCTTVVDVVWAVDGTGSYKTYIQDAKNNFKDRVIRIWH